MCQYAGMRADVTLRPLDRELLGELQRRAVADADPAEVMPPISGPAGEWTAQRRAAFVSYHVSGSLAAEPTERTFAIVVDGRVARAGRLRRRADPERITVEAGIWLGRSFRAAGIGGAVLDLLLAQAATDGVDAVFLSTKPDNVAVHRLYAKRGLEPVWGEGAVTAWVELGGPSRSED